MENQQRRAENSRGNMDGGRGAELHPQTVFLAHESLHRQAKGGERAQEKKRNRQEIAVASRRALTPQRFFAETQHRPNFQQVGPLLLPPQSGLQRQGLPHTAASQPHRKRSRERTASFRKRKKARGVRRAMAQNSHGQLDGQGQGFHSR